MKRLGILICFTFVALVVFTDATELSARKLRVGVVGSAPFKALDNKELEGIAVEFWQETAHIAGLTYTLRDLPSVPVGLKALERGQIDVLIGSISITAQRSRQADFSVPYFVSSSGILTKQTTSFWKTIKPFVRTTFVFGVGTLLLVLFLLGNIFWLMERKNNENVPQTYIHGVGTGMWFAIVTFTTVGYGDIAPTTRLGRVFAAVWMVTALITASSLTAGIATAFTLFQLRHAAIESPSALQGRPVSVVRGTTGVSYARRKGATLHIAADKDAALRLLLDGKVQAMVFDFPVLEYYLSRKGVPQNLTALESHQNVEYYAFCVRNNLPLLRRINVAMLKAMEKGELRRIARQWGLKKTD